MGRDNGTPILVSDAMQHQSRLKNRTLWPAWGLTLCLALQGCGLAYDALQYVMPVASHELDAICKRRQVRIGLATEPFRPFVFPAIWTDEGARVTGLDVELVRLIIDALSQHCGKPVTPVLHLVRFRDLFSLLNEGQLDLFVSAVAANTPSPTRAGFAYSIPYFYNGGISGIARRPEIIERVRANLRAQAENPAPDGLIANERALTGLTTAVQELTAAHLYAEANLKTSRLVLCDSLPAAFESADASNDPVIDVILGAQPVLEFTATRVRKDWKLLTRDDGRPFFLTQAHYSVVMAEESYRLRWFVNSLLFRLDESGRLLEIRKRWTEEAYAFPRRASAEGLAFDVEKMVAHYDQGRCRVERSR
ncbi:MAG: substrate-binding periplasmic protein [Nitrospiraceae bacterium]